MEPEGGKCLLLPSEQVLRQRLGIIPECKHFIENSPIISLFAQQKKYAAAVYIIIGFEKDIYAKKFKNTPEIDKLVFQVEAVKPKMVELILQDHPAAIEFLKKEKIMTNPIQFASEETLHKEFRNNFDHFAQKTSVVKLLANQKKYPSEVYMIVVTQMEEYINLLPANPFIRKVQMALIPAIINVIFKKEPQAIEWLKMDGWLTDNQKK
jgi:hypothetical protein